MRAAVARFAASADEETVLEAAEALAPVARLVLEPGWSFGADELDRDPLTTIRRELWRRFVAEPPTRPIRVLWYGRLRLLVALGSDLSRCVYVGGRFEPNEMVFWKTMLRPGDVFVDAGANEGVYTLLATDAVGAEGRVLAIEPSSREAERLEGNLRLNGLTNVVTRREALGAAPGEGVLSIAEPEHAGQNVLGSTLPNELVRVQGTEPVVVTTLDALVDECGLERLDGVKLDVEGSEQAALEGAVRAIARFRPVVQLEVQPAALSLQGATVESLLARLAAFDYRAYVFDGETAQLREPADVDELRLNVIAGPADWRPPTLPPAVQFSTRRVGGGRE